MRAAFCCCDECLRWMKKRGLLIHGFGGWKSKTEQPLGPAIGENFMAHGFPVARVSGEEIAFWDQKDIREELRGQVSVYNILFLEEPTLGRLTHSQRPAVLQSKGSTVSQTVVRASSNPLQAGAQGLAVCWF